MAVGVSVGQEKRLEGVQFRVGSDRSFGSEGRRRAWADAPPGARALRPPVRARQPDPGLSRFLLPSPPFLKQLQRSLPQPLPSPHRSAHQQQPKQHQQQRRLPLFPAAAAPLRRAGGGSSNASPSACAGGATSWPTSGRLLVTRRLGAGAGRGRAMRGRCATASSCCCSGVCASSTCSELTRWPPLAPRR